MRLFAFISPETQLCICSFCAGIAVACAFFTGLVAFVGAPAKQELLRQWRQERQLWKSTSPYWNLISDGPVELWQLPLRYRAPLCVETSLPTTYPILSFPASARPSELSLGAGIEPARVSFGGWGRMSVELRQPAYPSLPVLHQCIYRLHRATTIEAIHLQGARPFILAII